MSNYPHGAAAAAADKRLCGMTILRDEYYDTFGEAFDGTDDERLNILESFRRSCRPCVPQLPRAYVPGGGHAGGLISAATTWRTYSDE